LCFVCVFFTVSVFRLKSETESRELLSREIETVAKNSVGCLLSGGGAGADYVRNTDKGTASCYRCNR